MVQADIILNVRGNINEALNLAAQGMQRLQQNAVSAMPQLQRLTQQLQQAGFTVVPKLTANISDASLQTRTLATDFQNLGNQAGKTMSWISHIAMGVIIANFAYRIKDAITEAISSANEIYNVIRRIQVATGDFATSQAEYFNLFKQAAEDTFYTLRDTADAAAVLAKSGVDVKNNIEVLTATLNMGTISMMELGDASRVMVQIIQAFQMNATEASRIADVMAKVADMTTAEVGDLAHGMTYLAAVASMSGISFEEATAALGMLTTAMGNSGIASRGLRSALTSLASPSREARQEMARYGILQRLQAEDAHSLADITRIFNEQLSGVGDKYSILSRIFETQGATAFMQLMLMEAGAAEGMGLLGTEALTLDTILTALGDSTGYAADTVGYMTDSLSGDIAEFKRSLEDLGQMLLEVITPAARDLVQTFTALLEDPQFRDALKVIVQSFVDVVVPIAKAVAEMMKLLGAVKGLVPWVVKLVAAYYLLKAGVFIVNSIMGLGRWITEQHTLWTNRLAYAYTKLHGSAVTASGGVQTVSNSLVGSLDPYNLFISASERAEMQLREEAAATDQVAASRTRANAQGGGFWGGKGGAVVGGIATLGLGLAGMFLGGSIGQAAGTAVGGEAGGLAGGMIGNIAGAIGLPLLAGKLGAAVGVTGAGAAAAGGGIIAGVIALAMAEIGGAMNQEQAAIHTTYMQLLATDADAAEAYRTMMLQSGKDVTMGWREANKAGFDFAQQLVDAGQGIGYLFGAFRILQAWIGQVQEGFATVVSGVQQGIANWWTGVVQWWTQPPPEGLPTIGYPGLQTGGLVQRAGIFGLHAGEAVVPYERVQEMLSTPRDLNVTIRVEGSGSVTGIDADQLGDILLANVSRAIYLGKDYG